MQKSFECSFPFSLQEKNEAKSFKKNWPVMNLISEFSRWLNKMKRDYHSEPCQNHSPEAHYTTQPVAAAATQQKKTPRHWRWMVHPLVGSGPCHFHGRLLSNWAITKYIYPNFLFLSASAARHAESVRGSKRKYCLC